jgi:hypothetical protein
MGPVCNFHFTGKGIDSRSCRVRISVGCGAYNFLEEERPMETKRQEPGIVEDLGSIAGLYRTVIWMMGKRIRYGQGWEERMAADALQQMREEEAHARAGRHTHVN